MSLSFSSASGDIETNGEYTLNITDLENESNYATSQIQIDNEAPSVDNLNIEPRINDEFDTLTFDVSEGPFGEISNVTGEISGIDWSFEADCSGDSCEVSESFPVDELDHSETYSLDIEVEDSLGNPNSVGESFIFDDEYNGDEDPEVMPEPTVFGGEGPGEFTVTLDGASEDSNIQVVCQAPNWENMETEFQNVPEDEYRDFECDYPTTSFDRELDLSVKMMDRAGNSETKDIGSYFFDFTPPTIENLSAVVGVFNSDFQVSYDAHDTKDVDGLDVAKVHYQIDEDELDLSSGTNVSEVDGDFEVNTSDLPKGEHTVYAWAVDEAGRVSEASSFDFNFKPDAEPEVALGSVDSVSVTAGNSQTISVNVTNTGELFVGSMELSLNSDIRNSSRTLNDLKPGEMESGLFSVDTSSDDLGVHQLEFSTESPDSSRTVRFVVEANSEQEERINSEYDEYISKYNSLKENVTELKNSGLSDSRTETLDSNTSEFFSDMESAKRAKESGDLYLVEKHMEDISTDFQQASTTFETVQKEHQRAQRNQTFMMVFLLFIGLGGSGLAYIAFFSEQYELNMEALEDVEFLEGPVQTVQTTLDQYEFTLEPLENAVERVGELLAEEEKEIEEAEEQAFQGFT